MTSCQQPRSPKLQKRFLTSKDFCLSRFQTYYKKKRSFINRTRICCTRAAIEISTSPFDFRLSIFFKTNQTHLLANWTEMALNNIQATFYYLGVSAMDDSLYSDRGKRLLWNRFRCQPCCVCCLNYAFRE